MWILRLIGLLLISLTAAELPAQQRHALLIGNSLYQSEFGNLRSPKNDVDALESVLRDYGFQVSAHHDLDNTQMGKAIGDFSRRLNAGDIALFYYAGHAFQDDKEYNWLVPVRTPINFAQQLNSRTINAQDVLNQLNAATHSKGLALLLLDACREYVIPPQLATRSINKRGLAPMTAKARGTLISFATSPGNLVPDWGSDGRSHYVNSLISAIQQHSDKTVEQMFKYVVQGVVEKSKGVQEPWNRSSLIGDFCFHPKGCAKRRWKQMENNLSQANLQQFLRDYPNSDYSGMARLLSKQKPAPEPAKTALLTMRSNQYDDEIWVNGQSYGSTPVTLKLRLGRYHVRVTKAGFQAYDNWLDVQRDMKVVARLEREMNTNPSVVIPQPRQAANAAYKRITVAGRTYLAYDNGTALDTKTGLLWMRCSVGQTWTSSTCAGEAKEFTLDDARKLTTNFAGYSDWRIPSIEELRTLVYCSNGKPDYFSLGKAAGSDFGCQGQPNRDYESPTIVQTVFPNTPDSLFWSGSPVSYNTSDAWVVGFTYGYDNYGGRDDYRHVRLVRERQ